MRFFGSGTFSLSLLSAPVGRVGLVAVGGLAISWTKVLAVMVPVLLNLRELSVSRHAGSQLGSSHATGDSHQETSAAVSGQE